MESLLVLLPADCTEKIEVIIINQFINLITTFYKELFEVVAPDEDAKDYHLHLELLKTDLVDGIKKVTFTAGCFSILVFPLAYYTTITIAVELKTI